MIINRTLYFTIFFILFILSLSYSSGLKSKREILGVTNNKKEIEMHKFGNGKNVLIIIAGIHGNKHYTVQVAMNIIDSIKNNTIIIPDDKAIWVIPNLNPDGFEKNKKLNNNNVDLNRNFDTDNWKKTFYYYNKVLSAGEHPFSEPETLSIKKLFENIQNQLNPIVLCLHSHGNRVIPGNNSNGNLKFIDLIKKHSTYGIYNANFTITGNLTNWLSNKSGVISATIELKNNDISESNEITTIINELLKTNYKKDFIKHGTTNQDMTDDNEAYDYLLEGLPESVVNKIIFSEDNYNTFINRFKSLHEKEELLLLVNKKHYLPADYIPDDLIELKTLFPTTKKSILLRELVLPDIEKLFTDAKKDKIKLIIVSTYRSYKTQETTFNNWVRALGETEANRVSAHPGASQHQLGTTIDFNSLYTAFGNTKEGIWLEKNAYKYGFIMSYPKDSEKITGYKYEPWHFRYIGKNAAYIVNTYFDNSLELFLNWYWNKKID